MPNGKSKTESLGDIWMHLSMFLYWLWLPSISLSPFFSQNPAIFTSHLCPYELLVIDISIFLHECTNHYKINLWEIKEIHIQRNVKRSEKSSSLLAHGLAFDSHCIIRVDPSFFFRQVCPADKLLCSSCTSASTASINCTADRLHGSTGIFRKP